MKVGVSMTEGQLYITVAGDTYGGTVERFYLTQ
jgi:hypothetical protein